MPSRFPAMPLARRVSVATGIVGAVLLLEAAPALALDPGANSSAFGVQASVLSGAVDVPATPTSTYPAGTTNHLASVNLGTLGGVGAVNAVTAGDSSAGTSSATGSAADVALLNNAVTGFPAVTADLVSATCSVAAPADPTGSSTLTNAKIGGNNVVDATPSANTKLINTPGVLLVTLNEQTLSGGKLTVNAIHVQLGPIVNGQGSLADVIIGQATCGPDAAQAPVDAFSFQDLPLILGGLAVLVSIGFSGRAALRRLRPQA